MHECHNINGVHRPKHKQPRPLPVTIYAFARITKKKSTTPLHRRESSIYAFVEETPTSTICNRYTAPLVPDTYK